MESISVLPNTHAGKRGKASDICKHGILPYPKVLKIGKPFVLLWFQLKDRNVQMEVLSLKWDDYVEKKNGLGIGMHGVIKNIYVCVCPQISIQHVCMYFGIDNLRPQF